MNKASYCFLNRVYDFKTLSSEYKKNLYKYYEDSSNILKYDIKISEEDFNEIFDTIYDILRLTTIDDEDFERLSEHYLKLLMADACDGNDVNVKWFIDHVWYLCVGPVGVETEKYNNCIPFIQQSLIKKFNIEESIKEKVRRKIFTTLMTR